MKTNEKIKIINRLTREFIESHSLESVELKGFGSKLNRTLLDKSHFLTHSLYRSDAVFKVFYGCGSHSYHTYIRRDLYNYILLNFENEVNKNEL